MAQVHHEYQQIKPFQQLDKNVWLYLVGNHNPICILNRHTQTYIERESPIDVSYHFVDTFALVVTTQVVKREHPLEPVIHLVDEKGVGDEGLSMGRTASVATVAALRCLGQGKKGDEMAQKMLVMFKNPKEHADYLTSPRCVFHAMRGLSSIRYQVENFVTKVTYPPEDTFVERASVLGVLLLNREFGDLRVYIAPQGNEKEELHGCPKQSWARLDSCAVGHDFAYQRPYCYGFPGINMSND